MTTQHETSTQPLCQVIRKKSESHDTSALARLSQSRDVACGAIPYDCVIRYTTSRLWSQTLFFFPGNIEKARITLSEYNLFGLE
jgi:hypothetical protein